MIDPQAYQKQGYWMYQQQTHQGMAEERDAKQSTAPRGPPPPPPRVCRKAVCGATRAKERKICGMTMDEWEVMGVD